jgi:hypothetical protein
VLNYDFQRAMTPEFKSENDWMVKQFAKLGIQLEIRATDFNQYQDKTLKGRHQIFWGGWLADYPDAENFLFLLYGPLGRARVRATTTPTTTTPSTTRCTASCRRWTTARPSRPVIDRMVRHRAGRRALGLRLLSLGRPRVPAVGAQRQAQHPDPRHGQVLPGRYRAARAKQAEWNQPVRWPLALLAAAAGLAWVARRSLRAARDGHRRGTAAPPQRSLRPMLATSCAASATVS